MITIDAHQHFWYYDSQKHSWINDEMAIIRKNFLPLDLQQVYKQNNVQGCIAVQADETENETNFLVELSQQNSFIKGVVGWVDLQAENIDERLAYYKHHSIIKGFRHVLQAQEPSFMLQSNFLHGISKLQQFNFTYDILIFPKHLQAAIQLVKQNPNQLFIIDHIAKPYIKQGLIDDWKKDMQCIAQFGNVFCKISGMVTEADYTKWQPENFTPYLDTVVECFGTKRILFGSDWPVCLVAASYNKMKTIVANYFSQFSIQEQQDFFAKNAIKFYNL